MASSAMAGTATGTRSPHRFHIPVMGTCFTIDTPLRVAKYGIDSALSLLDDVLIEQMRKYHSEQAGEPFTPIAASEPDCRARRITAYLNLLRTLVDRQVEELRTQRFQPGNDITRYFELLPDGPLKRRYQQMQVTADPERRRLPSFLQLWQHDAIHSVCPQ